MGSVAALALLAAGPPPAQAAPRPALKLRVVTVTDAAMLGAGGLVARVRSSRRGRVVLVARIRAGDGGKLLRLGSAVVRFRRPGVKRVVFRLTRSSMALLLEASHCAPIRVSVAARARRMRRARTPRTLRSGDPRACVTSRGPTSGPGGGGQQSTPYSIPPGWFAGDLHVHTYYSHDSWGGPGVTDDNTGPDEFYTWGHSVTEVFTHASTRGLHFLGVSDHNDIRTQADPGWQTGGVLGLPSYENSLNGHAQMLGATKIYDNGDKSAATVSTLADTLRADGGVFQVNHPADAANHGELDWKYAYEVVPDVVEGWNLPRLYQPPFPSGADNDSHVAYWEGWLNKGNKVGLSAGSDSHWRSTAAAQGPGQPTTWVAAPDRSVPAILEGLRKGRTFLTDQPPNAAPPQIFLEADANGDGAYESMVGDTVPPGTQLRVRVLYGAGTFLRVIGPPGRQAFEPVEVTSLDFKHEFKMPAADTWVRAELFDPDLAEQRNAGCNGLVGSGTSYCRNQVIVRAMTAALYLRP